MRTLCSRDDAPFSVPDSVFFVRSNKCVGLAKRCTGRTFVCLMPLDKVASEIYSTVKTAEVRYATQSVKVGSDRCRVSNSAKNVFMASGPRMTLSGD